MLHAAQRHLTTKFDIIHLKFTHTEILNYNLNFFYNIFNYFNLINAESKGILIYIFIIYLVN